MAVQWGEIKARGLGGVQNLEGFYVMVFYINN
jgi:hypothetical protein